MYPRWFTNELRHDCKFCGKTIYPREWKSKKRIYRESKIRYLAKQFCDENCRAKHLEQSPPEQNYFYGKHLIPWNKGKRREWVVKKKEGYVRIIKIDGSLEYQHRRITECPKGMVVHHIDGNRSNNDPANLKVMTPSEHTRLHSQKRWRSISRNGKH